MTNDVDIVAQKYPHDIEKYKKYINNIDFSYIGGVRIGGVYLKDNPSKEHKVQAHAYFIADNNVNPTERNVITSPGAFRCNGRQSAVVVMLAKNLDIANEYGNPTTPYAFVADGGMSDNMTVADPRDAYMAANFSGVYEQIGKEYMYNFQGDFENQTYVLSERGVHHKVLGHANTTENIFPVVEEAFGDTLGDYREMFMKMPQDFAPN